ncbi:venom dipeptidyl peptidase 4-like isoform X3 [Nilaparvata lugens]|uniref:venom dipeptidyl peptidase 4-like isoform X3 n=1 Tax=Nilaparvata lugens TaxID=108931 RepID=UPI00193DEAA8|nr:venom dipeptidyl peptidase 4-like isoform X3 [Nilaparvata lugens]
MMNLLGFLTFWIVSTELSMVNAKNLLKLSDMINSPFSGDSYNGYWKSDVELGKFLKGNSVETYNVVTKKKGTALEGSYYSNFSLYLDIVSNSDDLQWTLIPHDCIEVYANSHLCITTVIEMKSGVQHILAGGEPVQIARFVTKSNAVIYVFKNDIYYTEPPYSPNTVVRLTLNGVPGVIFNGVCDWAYEDRIYKKTKAFYFSSDGAFMSYLSFDDSKLPTEHYSSYSAFLSTTTYQYAHDVATRMPKPGTPIPVASVHIICLKTKKEIVIDGLQPPVDLVTKENIAVQLDWADEKNVVVAWANRIQNYVVTNMCDVTTSKCQKTGEFVMELINNTETKEMLQQLLLPTSYKYEITLADGVSNASVYLKLPPNFDETKKYPFMLNIWGFPDDKQVKDEYSPPDICDYLATAMDVVVVSIDVRGSSGRGDSYTFSIYKKAGQVEVEDHIFVTKALMKKHSYIDPQRIAVFGIGYGGWIATMILARDTENIFKCGIAMNPITNFMYFDAFYTGKLLGLLADNPAGYNYTDVTQLYEGFRGKKYLLMAGTLAAESLYLHSAALARSLQMNLVPFRFMPFIEEDFPDADWTIVNNAIFLVMEVVQFLSEFYGVEPKSKA